MPWVYQLLNSCRIKVDKFPSATSVKFISCLKDFLKIRLVFFKLTWIYDKTPNPNGNLPQEWMCIEVFVGLWVVASVTLKDWCFSISASNLLSWVRICPSNKSTRTIPTFLFCILLSWLWMQFEALKFPLCLFNHSQWRCLHSHLSLLNLLV